MLATAPGTLSDTHGGTKGDTVKPGSQGLMLANRVGLARQHQESRLESVLGIRVVVQNMTTDAQHQTAVSPHQGGKGCLIVVRDETAQQRSVSRGRDTLDFDLWLPPSN
jgi:hypothetical protein